MRKPAAKNKPRIARTVSFPAATSGWVANANLASANGKLLGAYKLQNYFPLTTSILLRRGSQKYATIGAGSLAVESLMSYKNGNNAAFFGATSSAIYDITTVVDPNVSPAAAQSGLTSGEWSSVQFATTGGTYLVNVNASDLERIYDGSAWWALGSQNINRLDFDAQTANFTVGATVTGGTSGATGVIQSQVDNGTTGYLILGTITGTFQDNEIVAGGGGSATVNGLAQTLFVAISGVATSNLSYVWTYKSRLFYVEKNSMNAWYLPVDQIGGTASKFPMGGIFARGGSLLFGASWSLDTSGDGGLSEQCVFVSTEGEVAVYQGINPADAADWKRVGVYRIGKPLGPKAWIRAGGDIIIATDVGFVPLSQAIQKDYAALSPAAVSYPIEAEWNSFVQARAGANWCCEVWPEKQMAIVAPPTINYQPARMLVSNVRSGAWAEYTNWDGNCLETFQGRLFFGSASGRVIEANVTGADEGASYVGQFIPLFDDQRSAASLKVPQLARAFMRGPRTTTVALNMQFDYIYTDNPAGSAPMTTSGSEWGVGIWGVSEWGDVGTLQTYMEWQSVGGTGYAFAPDVQTTSGDIVPLDAEIIRVEVTYDMGDIVT
ncbi:neck protein [Rhizobium phage RHph_I3_18]|nr:neck protein [Rhizobium phage RHph_I3_18]